MQSMEGPRVRVSSRITRGSSSIGQARGTLGAITPLASPLPIRLPPQARPPMANVSLTQRGVRAARERLEELGRDTGD